MNHGLNNLHSCYSLTFLFIAMMLGHISLLASVHTSDCQTKQAVHISHTASIARVAVPLADMLSLLPHGRQTPTPSLRLG